MLQLRTFACKMMRKCQIKYILKGVSSNFTEAIYDSGVFLEKEKGEGKAIDESK